MERDHEGDVIMSVPQPVYMPVLAPRLSGWDQATLIAWGKKRNQYEDELRSRCRVTGESYEALLTPIKSSMDPRVLSHVARFMLKKPLHEVSDEEIGWAIKGRCCKLKNAHIPDLDKLFKDKLKMDLREDDTEARILKYFMLFDEIVEDNGLEGLIGAGREDEAGYKQRMTLRCKYLLNNVAPEMLKLEIERQAIAEPKLKEDEIALYEKLVERAREQQHYHRLSMELKNGDRTKGKAEKLEKEAGSYKGSTKGSTNPTKAINSEQPRNAGLVGKREKPDASKPPRKQPPRDGCLLCGGPHWVNECDASEAEKEEALKRAREKKEQRLKAKKVKSLAAQGDRAAVINGILEVPYRADTGADLNVISRRIVQELLDLHCDVAVTKREQAISVELADGRLVRCDEECELDVQVVMAAGKVNLRKLKCIIIDGDSEEFLLGNATLKSLGINVDQLLEQLAAKIEPGADDDDTPEDEIIGTATDEEVLERVNSMLDEVAEAGMPAEFVAAVKSETKAALDCWRVKLGADPPAKLEPLRIVLKPDAVPFRTKPRVFTPTQSRFLGNYGKMLEQCGYVVVNNQSRWACAAIATRKKGPVEDYRITPDYRPANVQTIPIAGAMPNLLVVMTKVKGACFFATFDLFKGFWQLLLHEDSREIFSFMTSDTVYTPLRVPQGATDSPIHFQNQMQEVFRDMLYENLLVWVDDIVLFAKTAEEFISVLHKFYARVDKYGLKLNANKSRLFAREVSWCGRVIDGNGVRHDPERVRSLCTLPLPATAADLQKFLCAANWLRESIVDYAPRAAPLHAKLEASLAGRSRKQRYAEGIALEWTSAEEQQYRLFTEHLATSAKLAFPSDDATVCVCTDASDRGWSLIVSQVNDWKEDKPLPEQTHELVMCKGGMFSGAQLHWSIAEKEGYPIVKAARDLEYLLLRPQGFKLFCDHANLIQIFCPANEVKKHVRGKLQRWSLIMAELRYEIEHIKGTDNVWADLVSRWLTPPSLPAAVKAVRTRSDGVHSRLRPLQAEEFVWPTAQQVRDVQQRFRRHAPEHAAIEDGLMYEEGKVWIPTQARELLTRILIVAHCGLNAHRGADTMITQLKDKFSIKKLGDLVKTFVADCLLCKHIKGGLIIQRPWSEPREPAARNGVLHFDFLFMGESYGATQYVLVLKDELTHFCELVACDTPTSAVTAAAILDWAKRFGMPQQWMSDNGTHFKNSLLDDLRQRMKTLHTFVPVYTPWVNGTVERINRDILQVMRVLLLEYQLDTKSWTYLLPLVQSNLNQTPARSLGNKAPIELFTGLSTSTPLDTLMLPTTTGTKARLMKMDVSKADEELSALRESLEAMHMETADRKEKLRLYQSAMKKGTLENFSVGDFVLWSRVDERLQKNKLMVRWVGPYRVIEAREYSYMIQHLLTDSTMEVHGSRLKFYHDASLEVNEEIVQHVSKQGIVMAVDQIKAHRYNDTTRQWELLISWRGLQDIEDSWEPVRSLQRDIPLLIDTYINTHDASDLQQHMDST